MQSVARAGVTRTAGDVAIRHRGLSSALLHESSRCRLRTSLLASAVGGVLLILVAGCQHDDGPFTTPRAAAALANTVVANDSAWDTLVADVTLNVSHNDSLGRKVNRRPPIRYRLERTRLSSGWKTVMTLAPRARTYTRPGRGPFDPEQHEVGRIEFDGRGPVRVFNGHGQEMRPADLSQLKSALPRVPNDAVSAALPRPVRVQAPAVPVGSSWAADYIALPSRAAARQAGFARHWGTPTASDD